MRQLKWRITAPIWRNNRKDEHENSTRYPAASGGSQSVKSRKEAMFRVISVHTIPGLMANTNTPEPDSSTAIDSVSRVSAALVVVSDNYLGR
jgi:hypothetical protein